MTLRQLLIKKQRELEDAIESTKSVNTVEGFLRYQVAVGRFECLMELVNEMENIIGPNLLDRYNRYDPSDPVEDAGTKDFSL